jgi:hypothetical protein
MDLFRYLVSIFLFMPCFLNGQDTVILTVHGHHNPQLEITGYRMHLSIDEMNTVCDPYTGKLTPEDQLRIFKDSLRSYGIDLSKFIDEGHGLRFREFYDDNMGVPHPNVVQRYLLEDLKLEQIRDVQAMASMLYIEIGDIKPIFVFPKGLTKESIIKKALDNAKVQAALIADAMQMRVVELVEVYDSSRFNDPGYYDNILFSCSGSVSVKAALVSN